MAKAMIKTIDYSRADRNAARVIFNDIEKVLMALYIRWLDERQYEDINEYAEVIKKALGNHGEFVKMHKRPFGFTFIPVGFRQKFQIKMTTTRYCFLPVN